MTTETKLGNNTCYARYDQRLEISKENGKYTGLLWYRGRDNEWDYEEIELTDEQKKRYDEEHKVA